MTEVSALLRRISAGGAESADRLLPLVYKELRRLAAHKLRKEGVQQTLQPTALVHEAWLRLVGNDAAEVLKISTATAERYWACARAWLHQELQGKSQVVDRAEDQMPGAVS